MPNGIAEPRNAEGLRYEKSGRFHEVISGLSDELSAEEVVESILQDVISYMVNEEERDDDITLVAVKVT
jgi:serine phosphatase RsbU (regulator of sigma subunit)